MANFKIFVSSTCYDLSEARNQLRRFILQMGYEPVMSEYSDILFDPREHTHVSCIQEIQHCDAVVLIIGSRFGGEAVPPAISAIDFDKIEALGADPSKIKENSVFSVTQLEVLRALEREIPVFTFIDQGVHHDHWVYEKNKGSEIISQIIFPSIEKQETAAFIFEFINFVRRRSKGNSLLPFAKVDDIEDHLRKQWAALLQRLLHEERDRNANAKQLDNLKEMFQDLQTAILSSISVNNADAGKVARGVIRFRKLIEFATDIEALDLLKGDGTHTISEMMKRHKLDRVGHVPRIKAPASAFMRADGSGFLVLNRVDLTEMEIDCREFMTLSMHEREVIVNAVSDLEYRGPKWFKKIDEPIEQFLRRQDEREIAREKQIRYQVSKDYLVSERVKLETELHQLEAESGSQPAKDKIKQQLITMAEQVARMEDELSHLEIEELRRQVDENTSQ